MSAQYVVLKDFSSPRFVRVWSPISSNMGAGGAGITLSAALARCRSEKAERHYSLNQEPEFRKKLRGIAAHPHSAHKAFKAAYWESVEIAFIKELAKHGVANALIRLRIGKGTWSLTRVKNKGWIILTSVKIQNTPMIFCTARSSIFHTLIKCWEEYRNPFFYVVHDSYLEKYTKANQLISSQQRERPHIVLSLGSYEPPSSERYEIKADTFHNHHICCFLEKQEGEHT